MKGEDPSATPERIIELLNRAVILEPNNSLYIETRGRHLFDLENYEQALPDLSRAAEFPGLSQNYYLYMKGLAQGKLGRYEAALNDFKRSIMLRPDNSQLYGGMTLAHLALGNLDIALEEIDRAISLDPRYDRWRYTRGLVLSRMGREADAIKQFEASVVYSEMRKDGSMQHHYYSGKREYDRCRSLSVDQMKVFWHYGGRWLPPGTYESYR